MSTHRRNPRLSKQQWLAQTVLRCGLLGALRRFHDRGRTPILILAYHRIAHLADRENYPLDLGLVSATPDEFENQMRTLADCANPVSLDAIAAAVDHGGTLPDRAVAVTFDDGFRDTFDVAYPILRRHRIPATVFVSTELIENNEPYWFEITAHLMLRIPPRALVFEEHPEGLPAAADPSSRRSAIEKLHRSLKSCSNARRTRLVNEWRERFADFIDSRAEELARPIAKSQILEMADNGIDFGSHTVSHPNLALASDETIERELRESKSYLERLLARPVRSLAYPFGTPDTYDNRTMACARASGYQLASSFRQGVNWLGDLAPMELRRIGLGPDITQAQFRVMMALPAWLHPKLSDAHA